MIAAPVAATAVRSCEVSTPPTSYVPTTGSGPAAAAGAATTQSPISARTSRRIGDAQYTRRAGRSPYDRNVDSDARPGRAAFWLATAALAWAVGFTVWAHTASFYEPGGETILEANGELSVRVALLLPAAISALVWLALHIACRDGRRGPRTIGLAGASVLLGFALLTGFTIGLFVLPGAIALAAAAVMTPIRAASCTPSSAHRRRGTSRR